MREDPDGALSLLAELTGATDEGLRELAAKLAGRVMIDLARSPSRDQRGVGKLERVALTAGAGDLDLDRSLDALLLARATGTPPDLEDLFARDWRAPSSALCLVVDRSGSMDGHRLAAAAVAVASVALRGPDDYSVIAFADTAVVIKAQGEHRGTEEVVRDVLRLRGTGRTDVALALRTAAAQLARSPAKRKRVVLLSDCDVTKGPPPEHDGRALEDLRIIAPADHGEEARRLASKLGVRWTALEGPSAVPAAFRRLSEQRR